MFVIVHIVIFTLLGPHDWCLGLHQFKLFLFLLFYNDTVECMAVLCSIIVPFELDLTEISQLSWCRGNESQSSAVGADMIVGHKAQPF